MEQNKTTNRKAVGDRNQADAAIKKFLNRDDVFADIINNCGRLSTKLKAEELENIDAFRLFTALAKGGTMTVEEYAEFYSTLVIKKNASGYYVVIGQKNMNPNLPLQLFLLEAAAYKMQAGGYPFDNDQLLSVCTVIVYLSNKPWSGSYHLHDLYSGEKKPDESYDVDYHMQIIEPARLSAEKLAEYKTDLKGVLNFLKISSDTLKFDSFLKSDEYIVLDEDAKEMINCIAVSNC
ncbi:MAG: hypothetical protein LUH52_04525 [Bacteroides uniformis]|nr:hypothetical protein [Bacteroides uniformis]